MKPGEGNPFRIAAKYLVLTVAALLFLSPFIWMLSQSLKTLGSYYVRPPVLLPAKPAWGNYITVLKKIDIGRSMVNSLFVAFSASSLQVVTSCLAAFAFATLRFPGRNSIFAVFLGTLMIPAEALLVPLFMVVQGLRLIDTYGGLFLPFAFTGFGIFLIRQFFLGLPRDLFSAAVMDGAGYLRILLSVYVPLSVPSLVTLFILCFVGMWNSLLWPLVVTSSQWLQVVAVRLVSFVSYDRNLEPNQILAGATVCVLPSLVVFMLLQRLYVRGYVMSGLKG
jgi:multiple sugar transport system permease protein